MPIYKEIISTNGTRYTKDKRFIKKSEVPADILAKMQLGKDVSTDRTFNKECLFCGEPAKLTRVVNAKVVYLCDSDFYSNNIGKIAEELRKQNG